MTLLAIRWLHLIAAGTWVGGMIVLAALVLALRRAGVDRDVLVTAARAFARVSWTAMAIAVATGVAQIEMLHVPWAYGRLHLKIGLVGIAVIATLVHQRTASRLRPAARGMMELSLLLLGLAIFAAAVRL